MTANPFIIVDKDTFYRFVAAAPEGKRYEFVRGRIVYAMTGGTYDHSQIALRFALIVARQLDTKDWAVAVADRGVETAETIRYPDVVVERSLGASKSVSTSAPVVIVEVLSETSGERDVEVKPPEYTGLPSLQAYIVASQDEPTCLVWLRRTDGTFPSLPATVDGRDQVISIPALGLAVPLAEVYRGIGA